MTKTQENSNAQIPDTNTGHRRRERLTRRQNFVRHTVPLAILASAAGAGIANTIHPEGHDHSALVELFDDDLHFSPENNTITLQEGETLWTVANLIEGREKIHDLSTAIDYITNMPENADIFDGNGHVRPGTQVYYPVKTEIY